MKKYLPSKTFIKFLIIIGGAGLVFLIANQFIGRSESFTAKEKTLARTNETLEDLFEKDTDGDGLKDWEEFLWGTDPKNKTTFDIPDEKWVADRRLELEIGNKITAKDEFRETETDRFSRELYMTLAALQTSDQVDATTIYNISIALGEQMFASELPDRFREVRKGDIFEEEYLTNLIALIEDARGLGNELSIANAVMTGETSADQLIDSATRYKNLAEKMANLAVPEKVMAAHLALANNFYKVGLSLESLAGTEFDPIVGIIGLAQYQRYSEKVEEDLENIIIILS